MASARDTALNIPELLQITLSYVPLKDLLVNAQRVSKTWREIVLLPRFQEALYFSPTQAKTPVFEKNPILAESNILRQFEEATGSSWIGKERAHYHRKFEGDEAWRSTQEETEAFIRSDASWRRMFVCQPPNADLNLVRETSSWGTRRRTTAEMKFAEGLRMGALYDMTQSYYNKYRTGHSLVIQLLWPGELGKPNDQSEPTDPNTYKDAGVEQENTVLISRENQAFKVRFIVTLKMFTAYSCKRDLHPRPLKEYLRHISEAYKHVEMKFGKKMVMPRNSGVWVDEED